MHDYTSKIRDFINKRRVKYNLLKTLPFWHQLCSSLDTIEDTDIAIDSYLENEFPARDNILYLITYGLLQVLFVQQDAVSNLCESLGIHFTIDNYPKLKAIKKVRNQSTGHATKKKMKKETYSYHFISRTSLNQKGFQLISAFPDEKHEFKYISTHDLILDQRRCLSEILELIIEELARRERAHKEKFRMEKLISIFPDTLGYDFEKIYEGITRPEFAPRSEIHLDHLKKNLTAFQDALKKRGAELETYSGIKLLYEEVAYPIDSLQQFFVALSADQNPELDPRAADIFTFFLGSKFDELKEIAKELDEDYAS